MFNKLFKKRKVTYTNKPYETQYNSKVLESIISLLLNNEVSFTEKEIVIDSFSEDPFYFYHALLIILLEYSKTGVQKLITKGTLTYEDYKLTPKEFQYLISRLLLVFSIDKDDSGSEVFIMLVGILILSRSNIVSKQLLSYVIKEVIQTNNIKKEHVSKIIDEVINMFFFSDKDTINKEKLTSMLDDFVH